MELSKEQLLVKAIMLLLLPCLAHADPQPTATEIFHLRTECGLLARKLFEEYKSKYILPSPSYFSYKSSYNTKTNRCYYLAETNFLDHKGKPTSFLMTLYDAQNPGDVSNDGNPLAIANSNEDANSFAPKGTNPFGPVPFGLAATYIASLMNPEN